MTIFDIIEARKRVKKLGYIELFECGTKFGCLIWPFLLRVPKDMFYFNLWRGVIRELCTDVVSDSQFAMWKDLDAKLKLYCTGHERYIQMQRFLLLAKRVGVYKYLMKEFGRDENSLRNGSFTQLEYHALLRLVPKINYNSTVKDWVFTVKSSVLLNYDNNCKMSRISNITNWHARLEHASIGATEADKLFYTYWKL